MNEDLITTPHHRYVGFLPLPCLETSRIERFRVVALEDMPWHGVKAGDLGGFVDSPSRMSQMSWVGENASVQGGDSTVSHRARIDDNAKVNWSAVTGNAVVCGSASLSNNCIVGDNAIVGGKAMLHKSRASGSARIHGQTFACMSHAKDNAILCGFASMNDNSVIADDAFVTGTSSLFSSTFDGESAVCGGLYIDNKLVSHRNTSRLLNAIDLLLVESQLDGMKESYEARLAMRK